MTLRICAVIPSRNHHLVVGQVVDRIRANDLPVYIVDDASDEPTRSILAALHAPERGITVLRRDIRGGKGGAVITGFEAAVAAGYSHVVQIDADGQHDLDRLPALLAMAEQSPDTLISGVPDYDESISTGRRLGRYLTHFWVWAETLSFQIRDSMCGFRAYPLAPVMALLASEKIGRYMDFDIEILVRLSWRGVPIQPLPVAVRYPPENSSNFELWRDNWRITMMHTRLVLTMLWRLPQILKHRRAARPTTGRMVEEAAQ